MQGGVIRLELPENAENDRLEMQGGGVVDERKRKTSNNRAGAERKSRGTVHRSCLSKGSVDSC